MRKKYSKGKNGKELYLDFDKASPSKGKKHEINRIFFFGVLVNTVGNIFTRGCATRENITDVNQVYFVLIKTICNSGLGRIL